MIQSLTSGRDKKLLQEAQQMLDDSRAKIEFLRMRIMKVRQARQQQHARGDAPPPNGETTSNKGTKLYPRPISRRVRIFNQRRTARTINYWPCRIQCVVVVSRGDWIVITGRICVKLWFGWRWTRSNLCQFDDLVSLLFINSMKLAKNQWLDKSCDHLLLYFLRNTSLF